MAYRRVARAVTGGRPGNLLTSAPGTYALVLHCPEAARRVVGRLGLLVLPAGYYAYVGSAFGPGGLRARVARHYRVTKTHHWHIDYLASLMHPTETWYTCDPNPREHEWADIFLHHWCGTHITSGFGASDCACPTHLFRFAGRPAAARFRRLLDALTGRHGRLRIWHQPGVSAAITAPGFG